eukprot:gene21236-25516_t
MDAETGECSSEVDDADAPIWRRTIVDDNGTSCEMCIGMSYSTEDLEGSPMSAYYYDAAYVVAQALDASFRVASGDLVGAELKDAMLAQDFLGVSGHVAFDSFGDRSDGLMYQVWNHAGQSKLEPVGYWTSESGYRECDGIRSYCSTIVWSTGDHQVPVDGTCDEPGYGFNSEIAECRPCPAGTFLAAGSNTCVMCAVGTVSLDPGATMCLRCQEIQPSFYQDQPGQDQCKVCPSGADCSSGVSAVGKEGYWRSAYDTRLYECYMSGIHHPCQGETDPYDGAGCQEGHGGLLCSLCTPGYAAERLYVRSTCISCTDKGNLGKGILTVYMVCAGSIFVALVTVFLYWPWIQYCREAFAERWAAQPATMDAETGECSSEVDDADAPIWRRTIVDDNGTSCEMCIGAASFGNDTSGVPQWYAYFYDAVYVVARALQVLLQIHGDHITREEMKNEMLAQSFVGVTGLVTFDAAGDRSEGVMYEVLNHAGRSTLEPVGIWMFSEAEDLTTSEYHVCHEKMDYLPCSNIVWSTVRTQDRFIYPYGTEDFSGMVRELQETRTLIIVLFGHTPDTWHLMEQAYAAGVGGEGYVWLMVDDRLWENMDEDVRDDVLRGHIGVRPFINISSPNFKDFSEKWTAQPATLDAETGKCSSEVDDAGSPIWRRTIVDDSGGSYENCVGLNYTSGDLVDNVYPAHYFDAVHVVMHGLQDLLQSRLDTITGIDLRDAMQRQDFVGATGRVTFDFAGDRTSQYFEVVNILGETKNHVGTWDLGPGGYNPCKIGSEEPDCYAVQWSTASNVVPKSVYVNVGLMID